MNNIEKLAIEDGSTCYTGQNYHFDKGQLEAFAKALLSSEPVAKPDAWLVPMILDFTEAKRVHFTRSEKGKNLTDDELKSELQGTVIWKAETVYINDSNEPITDKYGVRHYAKPLFTHPHASVPPVQSSEPVATVEVGSNDFGPFIFEETAYGADRLTDGKHDLFTHPPATVPLEKYNKLLEAVRKASAHVRPTCGELYEYLEQAIAEAEGKEG